MTYVEFFDKSAAENICACLANPPERVVFVGGNPNLIKRHMERYRQVFEKRDCKVEFVYRSVNQHQLERIVEVLSKIVEEFDDCVFGLTGGGDLYLVAMGIIKERYKHKNIQMHRFNLRNNSVFDCDQDGKTVFEGKLPILSVAENIRIYGGDIVTTEDKPDATFAWDMSDDFKQDINAMWEICRKKPRSWNSQIGGFAALASVGDVSEDKLSFSATRKQLELNYEKHDMKSVYKQWIISSLLEKKLLAEYGEKNGRLFITFKNEQVKRCLVKAGQVLEMKIFLSALEARDDLGLSVYNDVVNGVYIDWDGKIHNDGKVQDTENEIDILMMHGIVPVFVSCKNGKIETEELYKLNSVAERFGGGYAKKVLVAASLGHSKSNQSLRQRAHDMGIRVIEGLTEMSDSALISVMSSLWSSN